MNYLLYYRDGFIKKFPLEKARISIGRGADNDLVIQEDFISRNHVEISAGADSIMIRDLDSTNGVNFQGEKVKKAHIHIGESFILGKMEFFLKRGSLDEFKLADELIPIFDIISIDNEKKTDTAKTRYLEDILNETLKVVMQVGLKKNDFKEFLLELSNYLFNLTDFGSLFIVCPNSRCQDFDILLSVKQENFPAGMLKSVAENVPNLFDQPVKARQIDESGVLFYSYPIEGPSGRYALIFIWKPRLKKEENGMEDFLARLVIEIQLLSQLLTGKGKTETKEVLPKTAGSDDIIAESSRMKDIIEQAKKIARSEIFVLVHGESGTGKELIARLIHKYSNRDQKTFIAINCAAIPENLLESELFGHEKGAFTSAYAQKKGKLEMASGGTLVLDEIGDMPVNLQSKLLRAIQEREFYRVGGSAPIKVDLRIISITNRDLKQMIADNAFREDLYYRLVHRIIHIPPLRERPEDITALINHFTHRFCRDANKKISGYSVKAFEALQNHRWPGNIRQLENEIRSIVNLTDENETVSFDILSDELRNESSMTSQPPAPPQYIRDAPPPLIPLGKPDAETEKKALLEILNQHGWNKSRTARAIGMTYRGLHKKMKRLGLDSSD